MLSGLGGVLASKEQHGTARAMAGVGAGSGNGVAKSDERESQRGGSEGREWWDMEGIRREFNRGTGTTRCRRRAEPGHPGATASPPALKLGVSGPCGSPLTKAAWASAGPTSLGTDRVRIAAADRSGGRDAGDETTRRAGEHSRIKEARKSANRASPAQQPTQTPSTPTITSGNISYNTTTTSSCFLPPTHQLRRPHDVDDASVGKTERGPAGVAREVPLVRRR